MWVLRGWASSESRTQGATWARVETTEAAIARCLGYRSRKAVSAALRHPLAPLFIRVRHRAVRLGTRTARLPSEYWVLLLDPPERCANGPPDVALAELGLTPPAPPPGYARAARSRQPARQLPMVSVVPGSKSAGAFQRGAAEMPPAGALQDQREVVSHAHEQQHQESRMQRISAEMAALGVSPGTITSLLSGPGRLEVAARQLEWLPYRNPRNPAAALVAAIRDDWPPPAFGPAGGASGSDRPSALVRLDEARRQAEREAAEAELAMSWLATQPQALREELEQRARAELAPDGRFQPPGRAVQAVVAKLALQRMRQRLPEVETGAAQRLARLRAPGNVE